MARPILSVIGYIDMDLTMISRTFPSVGETAKALEYHASPGGKGSNVAVAAFRNSHVKRNVDESGLASWETSFSSLELQVRIVGAVGNDENGVLALKNLAANGVDTTGVRKVDTHPTGVCFCMVDAVTGDNRLLVHSGATETCDESHFTTAEELGAGIIPDLIISQIEIRKEVVEHILKLAHSSRIDVVLNPSPVPANGLTPETYRYATHLIVNETEAALLCGLDLDDIEELGWIAVAQQLLALGSMNVVITLGAQGAVFANIQDSGHLPTTVVEAVDATGAG